MSARLKKKLFDAVRLLLCVAALWIVLRGVTLDDQVTRNDGKIVGGQVTQVSDEGVRLVTTAGPEEWIPRSDLARDERGTPRIGYGLRTTWRESRTNLLLLAVVIYFPVTFMQALRFKWMVEAQRIPLSYWEALKLSIAGNFLNFATPLGSNAGDVFKAYFLSLHTHQKTEAVTTVFLDRVVGLFTLVLVVACITMVATGSGPLAAVRPWILLMLGLGVGGACAYFSPPLRRRIPGHWLDRLPMAHQIRRIDRAARTLLSEKAVVGVCILLTFILQVWAIAGYFTVALAIKMQAGWHNILDYYTSFYTGVVVQSLPGPPQGLGTVELTYRFFFDRFGSPSQIVCLALGIRLVVLICALPGLLVTMTGSYKPKNMSEIEAGEAESAKSGLGQDLAAT